ncbi:MAG: RluA family pseudouridine synthase [Synechococcaceae cyanobacterium]|nr:RluA family pseudouridine synthase [Synechococcaceae cyanobacterium]
MPSSTAWSSEPTDPGLNAAATGPWLAAGYNRGWLYRDRVGAEGDGRSVLAFYSDRYAHSTAAVWRERLLQGQILRNGSPLLEDGPLRRGDRLCWQRPPWREEAVPAALPVVFDDGDLLVLHKPSGLPVLPAGGFLEHTLLRLLERRWGADVGGPPRPVHRLGRFTSGLLVCARRPASRAWLSAQLRESTAAAAGGGEAAAAGVENAPVLGRPAAARKLYRALIPSGALPLLPGQSLSVTVPIGRQAHPRLGQIWAAGGEGCLPACSRLTLVGRSSAGDVLEVAIATGRPHQIRIHCAAAGAPLLGDPLYAPGGAARPEALPGDGGYVLHALALELQRPDQRSLRLEAPPPVALALEAESAPGSP